MAVFISDQIQNVRNEHQNTAVNYAVKRHYSQATIASNINTIFNGVTNNVATAQIIHVGVMPAVSVLHHIVIGFIHKKNRIISQTDILPATVKDNKKYYIYPFVTIGNNFETMDSGQLQSEIVRKSITPALENNCMNLFGIRKTTNMPRSAMGPIIMEIPTNENCPLRQVYFDAYDLQQKGTLLAQTNTIYQLALNYPTLANGQPENGTYLTTTKCKTYPFYKDAPVTSQALLSLFVINSQNHNGGNLFTRAENNDITLSVEYSWTEAPFVSHTPQYPGVHSIPNYEY